MEYKYEMSDQLFMDVWEAFGRPGVIRDMDSIYSFLCELVARSNGLIVLDFFSGKNYDLITRVERWGEYVKIVWHEYSDARDHDNVNNSSCSGMKDDLKEDYYTYWYLLTKISELRILNIRDHIMVFIKSEYVSYKDVKKELAMKYDNVEGERYSKEQSYSFRFCEKDPSGERRHACLVNALPFFSAVIQAKQRITSLVGSSKLMYLLTVDECIGILDNNQKRIMRIDANDYEELDLIGTSIRKIVEFSLKYFMVVKGIDEKKIQDKYGNYKLGEMKKAIKTCYSSVAECLPASYVAQLNELSHDSGKRTVKNDLIEICEKTRRLLIVVRKSEEEDTEEESKD